MPFHRRDLLLGSRPSYSARIRALFGSSIVGYWPQSEPSGTVSQDISGRGHNGVYTGVALGQPGIGDGGTSAFYDALTAYNNIYSAGLAADFNNQELTIACWIKPLDATAWSDATTRYFMYLSVDGSNNRLLLRKQAANTLEFRYGAGGVTKTLGPAFSALGWSHLAMTVSKAADQMKAYINGVQSGATQTGLGVWAGALNATFTVLGAGSTAPVSIWSGLLAHALLLNRAASASEIAQMATV